MCLPSAPKPPPAPEPPEPPPTRDDPVINMEATAKRKRLLAMKGRRSTILTSSSGDTEDANVGKTTLGA